jgi:hypothetical protein
VLVSTAGVDRDDGYVLRDGEDAAYPIRSSLLLFLQPGEHDLALEGLSPNCSVEGSDSVRVTIALGEMTRLDFRVACRAVTGAIEVLAPVTGRDFDPDGYTVYLDGVLAGRVYGDGAMVMEGVSAGRHDVRLDDFSPNCQVSGTASRTTTVLIGGLTRDTVRIAFQGECLATTYDIQILTTTEGPNLDPNGYSVTVDGELVLGGPCGWYDYYCDPGAPLLLVPNGSYQFVEVAVGSHVYRLGDIAPNCTVSEGEVRTASVTPGEISVLRYAVSCEGS